jgi:hypothetical protein
MVMRRCDVVLLMLMRSSWHRVARHPRRPPFLPTPTSSGTRPAWRDCLASEPLVRGAHAYHAVQEAHVLHPALLLTSPAGSASEHFGSRGSTSRQHFEGRSLRCAASLPMRQDGDQRAGQAMRRRERSQSTGTLRFPAVATLVTGADLKPCPPPRRPRCSFHDRLCRGGVLDMTTTAV